jgi:hypothetical protein
MDSETVRTAVETAVTGLVTLVAAFAGSWYAFRLSDQAKARETTAGHVAAINRAQFVLIQQYNALRVFQQRSIEPVRSDSLRFINMRPTLPLRQLSVPLDIDSLSFLLETDDREFVFKLLIEEQRFKTALQAINERSRLHIEEVQPRLMAAAIREKSECNIEDLVGALGEHLLLLIQRGTEEAVREVDLTLASTIEQSRALYTAMKKRFPGHTIIRFEPDEPSDSQTAHDAPKV